MRLYVRVLMIGFILFLFSGCASIIKGGGAADLLRCNVGSPEEVSGAVKTVLAAAGGIDILVNNAGINIRKPPDQLDIKEWDSVISTNLTSAFLCSRAVHTAMKDGGGGKIINIGSMLSIFGAGFAPAYAASKGGIVQFTRACASAWAKDNIQVNAIAPGWFATDNTAPLRADPVRSAEILGRIPTGRWGIPDDLKGAVVFLASDASSYVNGFTLAIDGGWLAR